MKKSIHRFERILLVLLACVLLFTLSISAADTDQTPVPTVTVDYDIGTVLGSMTCAGSTPTVDHNYYVPADTAEFSANGLTETRPTTAYWWIHIGSDGTQDVLDLYLAPGDLLAVTGSAGAFSYDGSVGKINDTYPVSFLQAGLGIPDMDYRYSNTAVVYGGVYYAYTSDGWAVAEAKTGSYYYETFQDGTLGTKTALNAANDAGADIILLKSVAIASDTAETPDAATTVSGVDIYCCNGSSVTVGTNGTLTLNGAVYNSNGSSRAALSLADGGVIDDNYGNTVEATYSAAYDYTSKQSLVKGTDTTLSFPAGNESELVSIEGSFAKLGGYFNLNSDTTINSTLSGGVFIKSRTSTAKLAVNNGTVTALCGFAGYPVTLTAGTLNVLCPGELVPIQGSGNGTVNVTRGTAKVYGTVLNLNVQGTDDILFGGAADLFGTAANATVTGAAQLTVGAEGVEVGRIANHITGAAYTEGSTNYYGEVTVINSTDRDANPVKVEGFFDQVSGKVTMSNNLTIMRANTTGQITCNSGSYQLEVMGATTGTTALSGDEFSLQGTFGTVMIHNVSIELDKGVMITSSLVADHASIAVSNGAVIGSRDGGLATCTVTGGSLTVVNSSVFAQITGVSGAELHLDADTNAKSFTGVKGVFDQITGRVYTCGDLTINGTKDGSIAAFDDAGTGEIFGQDCVFLTGGMTYYNDSGMTWALNLTDSCGSAAVKFISGKDSMNAVQDGGFKNIAVSDAAGNAAAVSLTMGDANPINIGSSTDGQNALYGLSVSGDAQTETTLFTNDLYGRNYGVWVSGTTVTLTGSDTSTYKSVTGTNKDGAYVENGSLDMSNYSIIGEVNGVTVNHSAASLTGVSIANDQDAGDIGLQIGKSGISTVTLDTASVLGNVGVQVDSGSALTLKNGISVTGLTRGVSVLDGSVTNYAAGAYSIGTENLVKGTGTGSYALFVQKGTVDLDSYTFDAAVSNGTGVETADTDSVTVRLSYDTVASKDNAYIWGKQKGIVVGRNTVMTLSDYKVYGSDAAAPINVTSGGLGAQIKGTLRLRGVNQFLGGAYGIDVYGGTLTNYMVGPDWTADEKAASAAPSGSGNILSGAISSSVALKAESNGAGQTPTVVLGNYNLVSGGTSVGSHGLFATGGRVFLSGDASEPQYQVTGGGTGYGVYVSGAATQVAIRNMQLAAKASYAGQVDSGILSLGSGVTLKINDTNGTATINGGSLTNAQLFVIPGNTAVIAQGKFENLTGYVSTSNDLQVIGTSAADAYSLDYTSEATVLGKTGLHASDVGPYDLILGTASVKATLADDSAFASVQIQGTTSVQQDVTVAGDMTVTNADMGYGFSAAYADVKFADGGAGTTYLRAITASKSGASGLTAGNGANLYLTDTVNIIGNACGMALTGTAMVTDLRNDSGDWICAYSAAGVPQGSGTIAATAGTGVSTADTALLTLGGFGISGTACGLHAAGNSEVFLLATGSETITSSAGNAALLETAAAKRVTIKNYTMQALGVAAATVKVSDGTVTLDGGKILGSTSVEAVVINAGASANPNVTLLGALEVKSGVQPDSRKTGTVTVTGADSSHSAVLSIQNSAKIMGDGCQSGVRINQYADVTMTGGSVEKNPSAHEDINVPVYGVWLTDPTATFVLSGGSLVGGTDALCLEAGSVWISGGTLDTKISGVNEPVVYTTAALWVTGGTIDGVVVGDSNTAAKLYINPTATVPVYLSGQFATVTGKATQQNNDLTVGNTTDAINSLNAQGNYANGSATSENRLDLQGAATGVGYAYTLPDGTGSIGGTFTNVNLGNGDTTPVEITVRNQATAAAVALESDAALRILGSLSGTVDSNGGKLYVNSSTAANVDAMGTFAVVKSGNSTNTVTPVDLLTINATVDGTETAGQTGSVYVTGSGVGSKLVVNGDSAAFVQGTFGSLKGTVTLAGDTSISGTETAVVAGTTGETLYSMTTNGSAAVTLNAGNYQTLTVNGGVLSVAATIYVPVIQVRNGTLAVAASQQLRAGSLIAGSGTTATLDMTQIYALTGSLAVSGNQITSLPTAAVSSATFVGWYVKGGSGTVISGSYPITGGEILLVQYNTISSGGGGAVSTYTITPSASKTAASSSGTDQWGSVSLEQISANANQTIMVTPSPVTSFYVSALTVTTANNKQVETTTLADGSYTFTMPSSNVKVNAVFAPILGTSQTTPAVKQVKKSAHRVFLNGQEVNLQVYYVNQNNYFKLRDVAALLSGTSSQFSIGFKNGQIALETGKAYQAVGGECVIGADLSASCSPSNWSLTANGVKRYLKCYNIGRNNYFQIRELGALLGFSVEFDTATSSVQIWTE